MKKTSYILSDKSLIKEEAKINIHKNGDIVKLNNIDYKVIRNHSDKKSDDTGLIQDFRTYTVEEVVNE